MAAALGAGTVAGSLIGMRWRPRHPMRLGMLFVVPWPPATLAVRGRARRSLVVAATVLAGAGIALFDVWWLTALAERIPPHLLSRVTSYDWMGSLALLPLGYILAGPLADRFGAAEVLLGGSASGRRAGLGLLPRQTRMLERGPGSAPAMPAEPPAARAGLAPRRREDDRGRHREPLGAGPARDAGVERCPDRSALGLRAAGR